MSCYYDGHYEITDVSVEELEKQIEMERKKSETMTEWEEVE